MVLQLIGDATPKCLDFMNLESPLIERMSEIFTVERVDVPVRIECVETVRTRHSSDFLVVRDSQNEKSSGLENSIYL